VAPCAGAGGGGGFTCDCIADSFSWDVVSEAGELAIGVFGSALGAAAGVSIGVLGGAALGAGACSGVVGSEVEVFPAEDSGVVGSEVEVFPAEDSAEGAGKEDVPDGVPETLPPPGLGASGVALESLPPAPEEVFCTLASSVFSALPCLPLESLAPELAPLESEESEDVDLCEEFLAATTGSATAEPSSSSPALAAQLVREPRRKNTAATKRGARFITTTLSGELTK
jgi:hypothetical protein